VRPANAAWRVQRNATEMRVIDVPGVDLRGQDQLLQIRLYADAPNDPEISLSPARAGTQGLSVSYEVRGGIGVSTIVAQIDRETIQALLPFVENGTEPGSDVVLAYDHMIALPGDTLKPYYGGAFIIAPGVSVPWTTGNIPVLPGVPQAEDLGAAIGRADASAQNADAKAAVVGNAITAADAATARTNAAIAAAETRTSAAVDEATRRTTAAIDTATARTNLAIDATNAAAAQIVADGGPSLLIKPGTGTFPSVPDTYFTGLQLRRSASPAPRFYRCNGLRAGECGNLLRCQRRAAERGERRGAARVPVQYCVGDVGFGGGARRGAGNESSTEQHDGWGGCRRTGD
jgi:hypothetical protein